MGGRLAGPMERLCSTGVPTLSGMDGETMAPTEAEIAAVAYPTPAATAGAVGGGVGPAAAPREKPPATRTMQALGPPLGENSVSGGPSLLRLARPPNPGRSCGPT